MWRIVVCLIAGLAVYGAEPDVPELSGSMVYRTGSGSYLGVGVAEVDSDRAKALSLKEERGVEITRVEADSPAAKAGLKVGDVVLEYNGQRVEGLEQFMRLVRETPVGREVRLAVSRGGTAQTLSARTAKRKSWFERTPEGFAFEMPRFEMREFRMPDLPQAQLSWRSARLGIHGESVDGQLAQYFGVTSGVLIRSVVKNSPAERAGLKAGDVITKIEGTAVDSTRDISSSLRSALSDGKKSVAVVYTRDRKEASATVAVEQSEGEQVRTPAIPRVRPQRI